MSMVIANNMQAVNTKRQFAISGRGQSSAMEKLSSGYKINTGKDDPSGLVISEKLRSQLNGLKRAQQNTEEGINVMGIAEGALNEMNAILKKMKALAIHSNNTGVTSPDQIAADQAEMDSAIQTLDRIAQTTKFSEDNLLNGAKDIAYETTTSVKGTQQNKLLDTGETNFKQIFKRDDYAVAISFTGSANAEPVTGMGDVDFTKQAAKAYLEVDTSKDPANMAQIADGKFTQDQQFTLTGTKGSRAFTFNKGETVATMVSQIKSVADSTGIDAALVFNSDQKIDFTTDGSVTNMATDASFQISGVNNAGGQAVTFEIEAGNADVDAAIKAAGAGGLEFGIEFKETAAVAGSTEPSIETVLTIGGNAVTVGWDGKASTLKDALTYAKNNGNDLAGALAETLTASGDIDSVKSVTTPNNTYGDLASADLGKLTINNIFGATGPNGEVNGTLDVDLSSITDDIDLDALRTSLSPELQAKFDNAAGALSIQAKLTGTQGAMKVELSLVDGSGNAFAKAQSREFSATELSDLATVGTDSTDELTDMFDDTIFEGAKIEITNMDKTNVGYDAAKNVNVDGDVGAIALPASTYSGGNFTKLGTIQEMAAGAVLDTAATAWGDMAATAVGLFEDGAGAKTTVKIEKGTYADAGVNAAGDPEGALAGLTFKIGVQANEGAKQGSETYSIFATDTNGGKYLLTDSWNGAAGTFTFASASVVGGTGTNTGTGAVANALGQLSYTFTKIDATATQAASTAALDWQSRAGSLTVNGGAAMTVAEGLYDYTDTNTAAGKAMGKVEIKMDGFDLGAWMTQQNLSATDQAALIAELAAGTAKLTTEVTDLDDGDFELNINLSGATKNYLVGTVTKTALSPDAANGETAGWITLPNTHALSGLQIQITNGTKKEDFGYDGASNFTAAATTGVKEDETANITVTKGAALTATTDVTANNFGITNAAGQVGGLGADSTNSARQAGTVAIFNNQMNITDTKTGKTDGIVDKGINGINIDADAASKIQLGKNTDGQGRIYVKFIDDGSYELYKDESLSAESLVGSGLKNQASTQANNSGLEGLVLNMVGTDMTKVKGVYFTVAGIEGESLNDDGSAGVTYNGDVVGEAGTAVFDKDRTLITGVELGKNTDSDGRIYLETVYNKENNTVQVNAYKDRNKRPEDLVAQSELMDISTFVDADNKKNLVADSATIVLNEKRNADNTIGTGLGMVLSTDNAIFDKLIDDGQSVTLDSVVEFKNLGARIFAQDYGSANFIKAKQDKGSIFHYYAASGDNDSKRMIDSTGGGLTVQVNGQDATLSVNGTQVKTNGLELSMATQDIQADLVFNQGKVGSTTLAQVGYETASIFTKIGALNLGSLDKETTGKYAGLSGLMANAGHVTNERVDNFQGGMQLQLGEGAGDQNRTVVAIKSLTTENLGRVTQGGYWEGDAIYSEKTFTMKDVFGGGAASLKQSPTLAMAIIEQSISDVSELRAQIGAVQTNMLQTNSNNLAVTMENIQKTESGIRDADMADEMTEFTKNQVLQSAAMSMMSQANQSSQNVLQLLR